MVPDPLTSQKLNFSTSLTSQKKYRITVPYTRHATSSKSTNGFSLQPNKLKSSESHVIRSCRVPREFDCICPKARYLEGI